MGTYNVVMGQALFVKDLRSNGLVTGVCTKQNDRIMNCSCVFLVNTKDWRASVYHFPAGDILKKPKAQKLLSTLIKEVAPTDACIVYGTVSSTRIDPNEKEKVLPGDKASEILRKYIFEKLPKQARLLRRPALKGFAWMRWDKNEGLIFEESVEPKDPEDLSGSKSAAKTAYGQIFWALDEK